MFLPSSDLRSNESDFFPLLRTAAHNEILDNLGPIILKSSPFWGFSIFIISAPKSDNTNAQCGPATNLVKSRILIFFSSDN